MNLGFSLRGLCPFHLEDEVEPCFQHCHQGWLVMGGTEIEVKLLPTINTALQSAGSRQNFAFKITFATVLYL